MGTDLASEETVRFAAGNYRYLPGVFQYSAGVVAEPGHRIVRARFDRPVPLAEAYPVVEFLLAGNDRPPTALCACELRSPAPFTEAGFRAFNEAYALQLEAWGLLATGANPVARSNVCPAIDPPAEPGFHAFVACAPGDGGGFVVSGSGETPEGLGNYSDNVIARGDVSEAGMRAKAHWVLGEMERRMAELGATWADATAVQAYTVHEMLPAMRDLVVPRGAAAHGLVWHFARPPVVGLEFEMDVRGVSKEVLLRP